jgi:hypothetical protein
LIDIDSITPEKFQALQLEVDALDRQPAALLLLEKMMKRIAECFGVPLTTGHREVGELPEVRRVLDCRVQEGATRYMGVSIASDGYYHCSLMEMADQYEMIHKAASGAAWYFIVGRAYPQLWGRHTPKRS